MKRRISSGQLSAPVALPDQEFSFDDAKKQGPKGPLIVIN